MKSYQLFHKETLRIALAFLFALFPTLIFPVFWPAARLHFFAPFLVILFYKKSLQTCLWFSLLCGLILDLLSSYHHLGLHAANYCATSALLYSQKRHFFEDRLSTIPAMTVFFSWISTILQLILLLTFEHGISFSAALLMTDLLLFPLLDGLYAFLLFTLPAIFIPRFPRREYFLNRK